MRTTDVVNGGHAGATPGLSGLANGLYGLAMTTAKDQGPQGITAPMAFDLAAYTHLLQQMAAAKLYPYDAASIAASLAALSPVASHLPLALTAPTALSLAVSKAALTSPTKPLMPSNNHVTGSKTTIKSEPPKVEEALDLRTQGLKSLYSSYRRANLDDIKPKVVEDIWVENDVKLSWTDSRISAYNPAQKLFMCVDCECVGFLSRVAEHWLGAHANMRVFNCPRCPYTSAWSRCVKMHLTRQHNEQFADTTMWKENATLLEVTRLMQELRNKVENRIDSSNTLADKRFYCPHCPYATDRRDLYTRHENIHKDDKPFHCYLCFKQFNRADHVKKHFVRMHPETEYDIAKIRKQPGTTRGGGRSPPVTLTPIASLLAPTNSSLPTMPADASQTQRVKAPMVSPEGPLNLQVVNPLKQSSIVTQSPKVEHQKVQLQPSLMPALAIAAMAPKSTPTSPDEGSPASPPLPPPISMAGLGGMGVNMRILVGSEYPEGSRGRGRRGDRAYTCPYCHWSGSDNWCLKRHMNTHIKPFACVMCDYKAARAERLSTHVWKVHNKRICNKCNFLADTQERLLEHTREEHHNNPYSRRYICASCGLTFDTRPALETHQHLSHPRLRNEPSTVPTCEEPVQDTAQDLSVRSISSASTSPSPTPMPCPVESCEHTSESGGALAEHLRNEHGGSGTSFCPHCGYELTQDEFSRDHWLTHHNEVCAACVHVFTGVYGPQLWKKVHVRPSTSDQSPLDVIVNGLNRKRTATEAFANGIQVPHVTLPLMIPVTQLGQESPSPGSDTLESDADKFNKRSRKQSCPKKVITVSERKNDNRVKAGGLGRNGKCKRKRTRVTSLPNGIATRKCSKCPNRPAFTSLARLNIHTQWHHGRAASRRRAHMLKSLIAATSLWYHKGLQVDPMSK
ncbi:unnamed protein product, partial [Meganyctiphanes norvegica]